MTDRRKHCTLISGLPVERLSTFGRIIAEARKALGISQKELAARTHKEGGVRSRRSISTTSNTTAEIRHREYIIEQLAGHLGLSQEHLIAVAGLWPTDLREKLPGSDPLRVEKAFTAFRKVLKDKHETETKGVSP